MLENIFVLILCNNRFEEIPIHMFWECRIVIFLWKQLKPYFD